MNFLAPIKTSTVVAGLLIPSNSEPEKASSSITMSGSLVSTNFLNSLVSPI